MTVRLDGIDLVIFDKDGTLIEFDTMWSGWAIALGEAPVGRRPGGRSRRPSTRCSGSTPRPGASLPGGGLAATPMARLRERTREVLLASGVSEDDAERALEAAWHAPDPVALARPLADLRALFDRLRGDGRRIAVATTDDRDPTERTLAALGVAARDRRDRLRRRRHRRSSPRRTWSCTCARRSASRRRGRRSSATPPADLRMARAAGAGLVVGVLTGVGGRDDLEPLADAVIASVEELQVGAAS